MLTFVYQNSDFIIDPLRGLQPVKSTEQQADVVKPRRREQLPTEIVAEGYVTEIQPRKYKRNYT